VDPSDAGESEVGAGSDAGDTEVGPDEGMLALDAGAGATGGVDGVLVAGVAVAVGAAAGCAGVDCPVGDEMGDSSPPGDPGTGMMTSLPPRNVGQCVTLE